MSVVLTGDPLTIGDVVAVARHGETVEVGEKVAARMAPARALVDDVIARGDIVYGITTGFGALAQVHIEPERVVELQHAIVRSHAAGAGDPIDEEIVRGMMLLRARTLAAGHAGARPELVDRIGQKQVRDGLTGNLCRCTGYEPIIKAALSAAPPPKKLRDVYPQTLDDQEPVRVENFFAPTTLADAVAFPPGVVASTAAVLVSRPSVDHARVSCRATSPSNAPGSCAPTPRSPASCDADRRRSAVGRCHAPRRCSAACTRRIRPASIAAAPGHAW